MRELILLDGEPIGGNFPLRSLFYGEGVFETFRWKRLPPVFLAKHLERMKKGAEFLRIPFPKEEHILESLEKAISVSQTSDAYVKVCLLSKGNSIFYENPSEFSTLTVIREYQSPKDSMSVMTSSFRRNSSSPINKIKSLNYLENILARREAIEAGFDEALFLNERGEITEGTASNLFWIRDEVLFTPSLESGLVPGITVDVTIEVAAGLGFKVEEGRPRLEEALSCDGAFLTNSLVGLVGTPQIDGKEINSDFEILSKLRKALLEKLGWL